jgi:putative transcriptional regulator
MKSLWRLKMSEHKSNILEAMHETASGLYKIGVMSETTMREFDALCLPPVKKYSPSQIKQIRLSNKASQAVFAAYLNTSLSTVQKWEQGQKKPNGAALKLLSLVEKNGLLALVA